MGIKTALNFSFKNNIISKPNYLEINEHINNSNLPNKLSKFFSLKDINKIISFMSNDKKNKSNNDKDKQDKEYVDLIAQLKVVLGDQVKDIRLSTKLTDSPVCLVADEGDMDIAMEQLMAQRDSNYRGAPRILEINGDHSLIKNMKSLLSKKESNDLVSDAGTLLFEQARLMEGKMPADPAQFSKIMNQFLLKAIPN